MNTITVEIKKPIYGNHVCINANIVERAIKSGAWLEIGIPKGRVAIDPNKWKAKSKIMKKVFKFPDNPMILYCVDVNLPSEKGKIVEKETKEESKQDDLFS